MRLSIVLPLITLVLGVNIFVPLQAQTQTLIIDNERDLQGKALVLEKEATLRFTQNGLLKNGTIVGTRNRIEADSSRIIFKDVILEGEWCGSIYDLQFYRGNAPDRDWQILSNIMKFNEVNIYRNLYFIKRWKDICMNGEDIVIHGNGARLILPSDKGESRMTIWGRRYNTECLFSSRAQGHRIEINDLSFVDTDDFLNGYGSNVDAEKPALYYYLAPTQAEVVLNNVHSNGQGTLLEIYNYCQDIKSIELNNCHIRTCQFAIEVANVVRDQTKGHLKLFKMDSCSVFRYPNAVLCGPISIVGRDQGVDSVSITHSVFYESNAGNIEISGVDHAVFNENRCTNLSFYDGDRPPLTYECKGNTFELQRIANSKKSRALSMGGRQIILSGNTYNILSKPFPFIELLQPWLVERFTITDNTINYIPDSNPKGFSCLFSIKDFAGEFLFTDNRFFSSYDHPEIDCNFPRNPRSFVDPSNGKIRITWR